MSKKIPFNARNNRNPCNTTNGSALTLKITPPKKLSRRIFYNSTINKIVI
jgi:hypothetical protein